MLLLILLGGHAWGQDAGVDVTTFGLKADFKRLQVSLAGQVATADGYAFNAGDVGKVLVIKRARSYPAYSDLAFTLNAMVASISGGSATISSPNLAQAVDVALADAYLATNNYDAIQAALDHCASNGIARLNLDYTGTAYATPFFSDRFRAQPANDAGSRSLFTINGNLEIVGASQAGTRLKIGSEDTVFIEWSESCFYDIFYLNTPSGTPGIESKTFRDFTLEGADRAGTVISNYISAFRTSYGDDQVQRVVFDGVDIVGDDKIDVGFYTSRGGRWDAAGEVSAFCDYEIRRCDWSVNCPLTVYGQVPAGVANPVNGSKKVLVDHTVFNGGGTPNMRKYPDSASTAGDVLTMSAPGFSFYDYISYIADYHRRPIITLEKSLEARIVRVVTAVGVNRDLELDAPMPVTSSGIFIYLYDNNGVETVIGQRGQIEAGSPMLSMISTIDPAAFQPGYLVKIVYERASCQVDQIHSPTVAHVVWRTPAQALDHVTAIINDDGRVGEGHTMYIHPNVSCRFSYLTITNSLKLALHHYSGGGVRGARRWFEFDHVVVQPTDAYPVERGPGWIAPIELSPENSLPDQPIRITDSSMAFYENAAVVEGIGTQFMRGQCAGGRFDDCTGLFDMWGGYPSTVTDSAFPWFCTLRPNTPDVMDVVAHNSTFAWLAVGQVRSLVVSDSRIDDYQVSPLQQGIALHNVSIGTGSTSAAVITSGEIPRPGILAFSSASGSAVEGDAGNTTVTVTVTRAGGKQGAVGISYATTMLSGAATATPGVDYLPVSGTLTWAAGDANAKTFTVTIVGDTVSESAEGVAVLLSAPTGGAALGAPSMTVITLGDDDGDPQAALPGSLQFSVAAISAAEDNAGTSQASITVTRIGGSDGAVGATFAIGGTATAGSDFTAVGGTLSWAAGDASTRTVIVDVSGDTVVESNETVVLTLSGPTGGASLGVPHSATLTIVNDDAPPASILQLSTTAYAVTENSASGLATITVTRSGGSAGAVSVAYATGAGTAIDGADYRAATGTLTWADGDATAKTATVEIIDDALVEGPESVPVTLHTAIGSAALGRTAADIDIIDDESSSASVDARKECGIGSGLALLAFVAMALASLHAQQAS
ncbi:MAG: hypothetical protein H0W72_00590 [Planctomycetes bacterium]|nr:hypothetical protein [Planctomycetota bacterium]